ncbi:MAG: ImmA/IrrE family metallo-endopeptidase [Fimbriimonadaceae bacterium]|nr:ImmA/IrrE family metallo-endopeptidase [Fimbriimonadaceae bacterium]
MIPFLQEDAIRGHAEDLLEEYSMIDQLPIRVEILVEKLGLDIVPIHGLRSGFGADGFLSQDLCTISVDSSMMQHVATRYHFTLAHELGHFRLHGSIIRQHLAVGNGHLMLWETLDQTDYRRAEIQANMFASFLLMPSHHIQTTYGQLVDKLSLAGKTFDDIDEFAKMRALRACSEAYCVSPEALKIRLTRAKLVQDFEDPEQQ